MKLPIDGIRKANTGIAALGFAILALNTVFAQNFYQDPNVQQGVHQQAPPMPGALLAGGVAAAQGNQFMDAQGKPIVMPASYCQGCPPGGGYPGDYGDPMAVDFGGYGQDQCGPHYFDISFDAVFIQPDDLFSDVGAFSSIGVGAAAPRALDPTGEGTDYEAGWKIAGRYDIGALAVFEATYMGLYDFGFSDEVRSVDVAPGNADNQLYSVFSNFGLGDLIAPFDEASVHRIRYESELQSTELSYRRYWVGNNPRISGTYLLGARYIRLTEEFSFFGQSSLDGEGSLAYGSENDLVGFQFGGDMWAALRQGLRAGIETKAGVYNNSYKFKAQEDVDGATINLPALRRGDQVAFVIESGASFVADILPSWSLKGGYQMLYINSLTTVGGNIATDIFETPQPAVAALDTQEHAFYHGFHGGMEYVW